MAQKRIAEFQIEGEDDSALPPPTKKQQQQQSDTAKYHLVKKWNLANGGYRVTAAYWKNEPVVIISNGANLSAESNEVENPMYVLSKEEFSNLMAEWKKIDSAARKRQCGGFVLENLKSNNMSLIFKLGSVPIGADGETGYGLRMFRRVNETSSKHIFLTVDSIQKITRAQKFIIDHVNNILKAQPLFDIMQEEIVIVMHRMNMRQQHPKMPTPVEPPPAEKVAEFLESIVVLDKRSEIMNAFDKRAAGVEQFFNKYTVYEYFMNQIPSLLNKWEKLCTPTA
jgi:hypothetical protein